MSDSHRPAVPMGGLPVAHLLPWLPTSWFNVLLFAGADLEDGVAGSGGALAALRRGFGQP